MSESYTCHLPAVSVRILVGTGQHTQRFSNEGTIYRCVGKSEGTNGKCEATQEGSIMEVMPPLDLTEQREDVVMWSLNESSAMWRAPPNRCACHSGM